ncbi:hypothetical protein [Roseibium sp.]|uniref:hypothetical protein n=1 Tax=Roseibium sp. TaxID=1936156 RepID=UPI003D0F5F9A
MMSMLGKNIVFGMGLLILQFSNSVSAQNYQVDLALPDSEPVVGTTKTELVGSMGQDYAAILNADSTISHQIMSSDRAYNGFYRGLFACVSPDSKAYYPEGSGYLDSKSLSKTSWVAVTAAGKPVISDQNVLKDGLKVGLPYEPAALLPVVPQEGMNYEVADNYLTNLKKVAAGRLDVAVLPLSSIDVFLDKDKSLQSAVSYDPDKPLAVVSDAIMCHDSEAGRAVLEKVNTAIQAAGIGSK